MRERCNNPKSRDFESYGGRGIKVCKRWDRIGGFVSFLADMGKRPSSKHSIDRINNDGDYKPSNCRWVDRYTQKNNCRNTVFVTWKGKTQTLRDWSLETGVPLVRLKRRYYDKTPLDQMMNPKKYK